MLYDRKGQPITLERYAELMHDLSYRRVAEDRIGHVWVSTVWLGVNHQFIPGGPPLIFETMIFGGPQDEDCWRYSTEEEALAGHRLAVREVRTYRR